MGLDNINEVSAMADRLSIPQLQQAMRDGTLPAYVGLPILQQKAKLQKQMQSAAMAQQPKAPTVAQQVESEAPAYADGGEVTHRDPNDPYGYGKRYNSDEYKGLGYFGPLVRPDNGVMTEYSVSSPINGKMVEYPSIVPTLTPDEVRKILNSKEGEKLPASVYDKAEAHARQRILEGKNPFANERDLEYADGGIVAFDLGGRVPNSYSQKKVVPLSQLLLGEAEPLYPEQVAEQRAPVQPEDRADYSELEALRRKQRGESPTPVPAIGPTLWEDIKSGTSKILPTGADVAELRDYFSKVPAEQAVQQAAAAQQPTPVQAAPVQQPQVTPSTTPTPTPTPTAAPKTEAEVNRVGAHRMMGAEAVKQGMANVGTGGPANFLNPAAVEQIAAQTQTQAQAPSEREEPVTVSSAAKEYKDYLGEDAGVSKMQKQLDQMRADKEAGKDSSLWNALMMGGLQYAGGANLGQAGTAGLNVWTEGQKEARKQEEKLYGLQNDLEQALRTADVKAADYGFKSKEAYDARKHAEKLQAMKDAADIKGREISGEYGLKTANVYASRSGGGGGAGVGAANKAALAASKQEASIMKSADSKAGQIVKDAQAKMNIKDPNNTPEWAQREKVRLTMQHAAQQGLNPDRIRELMSLGSQAYGSAGDTGGVGGANVDRNAMIEALKKRGF